MGIDAKNIKTHALAKKALQKVVDSTLESWKEKADYKAITPANKNIEDKYVEYYQKLYEHLTSDYLTLITNVARKLTYSAGLDELSKYLLTEEYLVIDLFERGIKVESIASEQNLIVSVKRNLEKFKKEFYHALTDMVLTAEHIDVSKISATALATLKTKVYEQNTSVKDPNSPILDLLKKVLSQGQLPAQVDAYLADIGAIDLADTVKTEMVRYLADLRVDTSKINNSAQDELFGVAYAHAMRVQSGREDPIDNVYNAASPYSGWNFNVDYFDSIAEQGISRDNILAAGALDYVRELGDNLGIFRCVDTLVLMWAQGSLDLASQESSSKLYRYYKLRENRLSFEERSMIYRQVINKGSSRLLSRMVPNKEFSQLWERLMNNVVDYIQKSEALNNNQLVSRSRIYQATSNLQHNLTSHMVGKPLSDVHELYSQMQEAIEILTDPDVMDHFVRGSDRNLWSVVEQISRNEMQFIPNTSAIRAVAVEGNKIFRWIADFDASNVSEDAFTQFLHSAESYIISQSEQQSQPMPGMTGSQKESSSMYDDYNNDDNFDDGYDDDYEMEGTSPSSEELNDWD